MHVVFYISLEDLLIVYGIVCFSRSRFSGRVIFTFTDRILRPVSYDDQNDVDEVHELMLTFLRGKTVRCIWGFFLRA